MSKPVSLAHSPHPGWSHEHDTNMPVFYNKPGPFLIKLLLPTDCGHPVCIDIEHKQILLTDTHLTKLKRLTSSLMVEQETVSVLMMVGLVMFACQS